MFRTPHRPPRRSPSPHRARRAAAPPALPAPLDRLSEHWWRARPRTRYVLGALAALLPLVAGVATGTRAPVPQREVLVAHDDLDPGESLDDAALRREQWPADLVPEGALGHAEGTLGAPLPRGAVATDRHVGEASVAGVPPGRVAVPVARQLLPALTPGTRLDVIGASPDGGGRRLATGAVVAHLDAEHGWLAVTPDEAVAVSVAAGAGTLAVAVEPRADR